MLDLLQCPSHKSVSYNVTEHLCSAKRLTTTRTMMVQSKVLMVGHMLISLVQISNGLVIMHPDAQLLDSSVALKEHTNM